MIDWVDAACREWSGPARALFFGKALGWPSRSLLGRLVDEGPTGASTVGFYQPMPESFTGTALDVSRALRRMAETQKFERPWIVVHAHYIFAGRAPAKAQAIKITVPQYWRELHTAHAFIAARLEEVPRETKLLQQETGTFRPASDLRNEVKQERPRK